MIKRVFMKNTLGIYSRKLAATVVLGWFPRKRDRLIGDLFILQGTFWCSRLIQDGHLEATFVYAAAVLQQQVIQSRIGSLGVDNVHDRVIAYRRNRRPVVGLQLVASNAPGYLRCWLANEVDIHVEDESSFDTNILQGCLDLWSHWRNFDII